MTGMSLSHRWDVSPREATVIQSRLRSRLKLRSDLSHVSRIAGVDVSYSTAGCVAYAAVVVMTWPKLDIVEVAQASRPISFPYVPGLLTFREGPAVLEAWGRRTCDPDLVYFDGQGIAHPRRMGIAAHLGLLLDVPSIGCAKTSLIRVDVSVGGQKGERASLIHGGVRLGVVLRTRSGVRPLYVSPGHRMDCDTATAWTLAACVRYRVPEPLRAAHHAANALRTAANG
jgi:deoxyribonuclease V